MATPRTRHRWRGANKIGFSWSTTAATFSLVLAGNLGATCTVMIGAIGDATCVPSYEEGCGPCLGWVSSNGKCAQAVGTQGSCPCAGDGGVCNGCPCGYVPGNGNCVPEASDAGLDGDGG